LNLSFKTAISNGVGLLALSLLLTGCLAPPIMFPRTSAHGVVVDQYGKPVPNAELKASWTPVRIFYMVAPVEEEHFKAHANGTWRFSVRKVERLFITAIPPQGYEKSSARDARTPEIHGGERSTNTFILKLRKIEEPSK